MSPDPPFPPAAPRPRRDRFKQLQAFCEVVRAGSITDAAKALDSSQPGISNLVRTLEDDLGAGLFHRRGGRITPTRIGQHLHRVATPLVEGLVRLPVLFDERHTGRTTETLRIGVGQVTAAYVLPAILQRYLGCFPGTRIELRSGAGTERMEWLRAFELDLVVAAFDVVPPDLEVHPLVEADAVVITPEDHPLGRRQRIYFEELAGHPLVVPPAGSNIRGIIDTVLGLHGVRPPVALEVDGWGPTINHVAAGVGVAFVPELCVSGREPVRLVRLAHRYRFRAYGIAVRRNGLIGLAARRFLDLARGTAGNGNDGR